MSRDLPAAWTLRRAAGLVGILSAAFVVWVGLRLDGPRVTDAVDDLGQLVAPLIASAMCGWVSWRIPRSRLSWGLLAASCACWAGGEAVWSYYDVFRRIAVPFPSLADAGYLGAVPLAIAGLLTYPGVARKVGSRMRGLLDAAMIAGSLLFASWAIVLGPTFREHHDGLLKQVLSVSYPASDVAMVSLAVIVTMRAAKRDRTCLILVMAGIVGFAISDSGFAYLTAVNAYGIGSLLDTGWVVGYFLIALGALQASKVALGGSEPESSDRVTLSTMLTPYAVVGLAAMVTLQRLVESHTFGLFLPVEGFLLVLALSVRQIFTLWDNVSLNRRLVVKVARGSEQLRAREERFAALVQHSSDPITIVDPQGLILFESPSVQRVLAWDPEPSTGRNFLEMMHIDDRVQWAGTIDRVLARPGTEVTAEWRLRHADGSWRALQSVVTNLLDEPSVGGLVLNSRDVTGQKALEEQLRHDAFHDPLTSMANRALFVEHLTRAVSRCGRSGASLGVMFIDLCNFKAVNDLRGRARGDLLLQEVADRLRAGIRDADVIARLGGDEFGVLFEGDPQGIDPDATALRLVKVFSKAFGEGTNEIAVQAAIGVAVSGVDILSAQDLLRNADLAIGVAKKAGPGRYTVYTPAIHQGILDRMRLDNELGTALERNELELYYQPIVETTSGKVEGVEALIRWFHPDRNLISPDVFIPVAEASGLIVTIGEWVIRQACRDLGRWTKFAGGRLRMSVNVSARQLSHPGFEAMVVKSIEESQVDPSRITLEITESLLMADIVGRFDALARLRLIGVRIAIDDFGTGYSSLSALRDLPVDILKIDKSFVDNIAFSPEAARLVQTIIQLAKDLELATVAEGAENREQVEILRELGCDAIQGYYFSKPIQALDLETLLLKGLDISAVVSG